MSEATAASRFSCESCNRSYTLKPELAGRRVKCKCGHVMTVPQPAPPEPGPQLQDDLYDFAPDAAPVAPTAGAASSSGSGKARVPLAPSGPRELSAPRVPLTPRQPSAGPTVAVGTVPGVSGAAAAPNIPIAYQQGPTQRQRERMSAATLMDLKRDVYVPVALSIIGFLIYVGYYAIRYELGGTGVALTSSGLGIMIAFKAVLLIGFAFVVAGPMGVSFGGIGTAALKLAAIAVFCDGVTTWIDAGVAKMSGGAGGAFAGMMSFPIAIGIYWVFLIYLFSMDPGDSWIVVILLAIFDFIVRWLLLLLLLQLVLNWGGASGAVVPTFGGGGAASASADPMVAHVKELKELKLLREAREYIDGGRQLALKKPVDAWYAAGCKNVWFSVSRDFNGKESPGSVIVELPKDKVKDKEARAKCYAILKEYFEEHEFYYDDPDDVTDTGDAYITVPIRTGG